MTTPVETIVEAERAAEASAQLLTEARHLTIETAEDIEAAADLRRAIKRLSDQAEADRAQLKRPILDEGRRIDGAFKPVAADLEAATRIIDAAMRTYNNRERERARAEEIRRREEAERERQTLAAMAQIAVEEGMIETAEELTREAEHVPTPIITANIPKAEGLSSAVLWRFEITDVALIPRQYVIPDERAIGGVVRALKGATNIPGIRVYSEESFRSSRQ